MAVLLWQEQTFIEPLYIHCSFSSPGSSLFVRCVVVTLSLFSPPPTNISFQKLACCRGRSDVMQATPLARTPWLSIIISPKWWRPWPYCLSRSPSLTPLYYRYHPKAVWYIVIYIYMLRTDCQPDRFINGPPVYKPVGRFVIRLACF